VRAQGISQARVRAHGAWNSYLWSHLFFRRRHRLQAVTFRKADEVAAADAGGDRPLLEWLP
jgi:hypothetical protein